MLHKIVEMKDGWYIKVPYFFNKMDMAHNRFDPVTMGIALMAGGTALQVSSGLREGKEAAKAGKYAQLMYDRQAKAVEAQGLDEIRRLKQEGQRLQSRQIVNIAAGGGTPSGTSLKAIVNSAANVEADASMIARNVTFQADTLRYQGAVARYEGQMARYASRIRAATQLGQNVGSLALLASKYGGKPPTGQSNIGTGYSPGTGGGTINWPWVMQGMRANA